MIHILKLSIPWNKAFLKNHSFGIKRSQGWPLYLKAETRAAQEDLAWRIKGNGKWNDKQKIYIRIHVYKPSNRMDAIGVLDRISDAIQMGTGVNDRWYVIDHLDWTIDKKEPRIDLEIWQE